MPLPGKKTRGNLLLSQDWNDLIDEAARLNTAKVNKAGDQMSGPLTIDGSLSRHLTAQGVGSAYLNLRASSGGQEILIGADGSGGIVSTMSNHDLQLRAGGNVTRVAVKASGRVGIGTNDPSNMLHIAPVLGLRVGELYMTGNISSGSSLTFNAHRNDTNTAWVFPRQERLAVTLEMDDSQGNIPRFEVFTTTPAARTTWVSRFKVEGHNGNIYMTHNGGQVGIGTASPGYPLHVVGGEAITLFQSTGAQAYIRIATSEGLTNRVEITNRPGGRLSLWTAGGGDVFNILRTGLVGIATQTPDDRLHVATSMTVGRFRGREEAQGRLTLSGSLAELALVRRNLTAWPTTPVAGDRFVWYNQDGNTLRVWTEVQGDLMGISKTGDVGIGTISPAVKLHVVGNRIRVQSGSKSLDMRADGNALDLESTGGELYINNNNVRVHIRNANVNSSRMIKEDIQPLESGEALYLLENLEPVKFYFRDDAEHELHLGFVAEDVPDITASPAHTSVKFMSIIAILCRALKEQQRQIEQVRAQLKGMGV